MADSSQVKEITDKLEQGVKDLFASDAYAGYLKTMSRFHKYSTRNTLLIHMQHPGATLCNGYRGWQSKFGRSVKKGEKAIKILAPAPYTIKEEKEKLDPVTRLPVLDDNGMPVIEYSERQTARFKVVSVFDISSTTGKPLPTLVQDLTGNVEQYEAFMDALRAVSPLPIVFENLPSDTDGLCRFGREIAIREGMSEVQTVCAVIHELTHIKLHDLESLRLQDANAAPKDRRTEELEAEAVAFSVCAFFNIETDANSFGYIAEYSRGRELKELNSYLDTVRKTASELIDAIDGRFKEIAKERNIAFAVGEEQAEIAEPGLTTGSLYAKYCNIVADRAAAYAVSSATLLKTDEKEARRDCGQIVSRVLGDLLLEAGGHYPLYARYMDDPDFKARLEDYAFIRAYLEPSQKKEAESRLEHELHERLSELLPETAETKADGLDLSLPDPLTSAADRDAYGYTHDDMLPMSSLRAAELFDADHCIYLLYPDDTESMALDRNEIRDHDGLCGIEREDWERSPVRAAQLAVDANAEGNRESELLYSDGNRFGIYQIRDGIDGAQDYRFASMMELEEKGLPVDRANYALAYTAPFPERIEFLSDRYPVLNRIYEDFNINHPDDFTGRSVSNSDVIVLKYNGDISAHYVDSAGFKELDNNVFFGEEVQKTPAAGTESGRFENSRIAESSPPAPSVAELEADAKAGKTISILDLSKAVHAERGNNKDSGSAKPKPKLMEKLDEGKRKAARHGQTDAQKNKSMEARE